MKFIKFISIVIFLFISEIVFSQTEKNTEIDKTTTQFYEISYNKTLFDFYDQPNFGFVLFYKFENNDDDYLDCLKLSIDDLRKYKTMDLDYLASLQEYVLKSDFKIIESKKIQKQDNQDYFLFVYEKSISNYQIKIHHRIYFKNGYGYNFSLRTVTSKFDKLYLNSEPIFNSFKLLN